MWALLLVLSALLGAVQPALAQVTGRVVDDAGRPLPAIPVEAWTRGTYRARVSTGADGHFHLADVAASDSVRLVVRAAGYQPLSRDIRLPAGPVTLRLDRVVVTLDAVVAQARPSVRCPFRDDPAARALWGAIRRGYDRSTDTLGASFFARQYDGAGSREEIGRVDERRIVRAWDGVPGTMRAGGPFEESAYHYAFPITATPDPMFAAWGYRELWGIGASHFLEDAFGARHAFRVLGRSPDATVLAFCPGPAAGRGARLEGALTLRRDTTLAGAEWRYRTEGPAEEAGAEVSFLPPREAAQSRLLPAEALFWRRLLGRNTYVYRWKRFIAYEFHPRDILPPRPTLWLSGRDTVAASDPIR